MVSLTVLYCTISQARRCVWVGGGGGGGGESMGVHMHPPPPLNKVCSKFCPILYKFASYLSVAIRCMAIIMVWSQLDTNNCVLCAQKV